MDAILKSVDAAERLLGHSPHPAIVALPLGAFSVSNISDVMYLATGEEAYDHAAAVSMAIGLAGASIAVVTGLRDYSRIPRGRQPNHRIATTHGLGNAVVGSLFAASYVMRLQSRTSGERAGVFPRLLALAGGALSLYTAWLGGKLVQEQGEAVKPVMDRSRRGPGRLEGQSRSGRDEEITPGSVQDKPLHELVRQDRENHGWPH
jgi:uncharacterized membrane protein